MNWLPLRVNFNGPIMSSAILSLGFSGVSGMSASSLGRIRVSLLVWQALQFFMYSVTSSIPVQ